MLQFASATVLAIFLLAFVIQFLVATHSLRQSWFISIAYLVTCAILAVLVTGNFVSTRERLDRLLADLTVAPGSPVRIDDTTILMEIAVEDDALVYKYEVHGEMRPPPALEAVRLNCEQGKLRAVLELGGEIRHRYTGAENKSQEIIIERQQCG